MKFLNYTIRWVASNLSVPFWMVGHVHLSVNVYKDIHEILASFGMNIIVAIGFWLEYKKTKKMKNNKNSMEKVMAESVIFITNQVCRLSFYEE